MMAGDVQSSSAAAQGKRDQILSALGSYTSFQAESAAALSDGAPPAHHDERSASYASALSGYADAVSRDADALVQVGMAFDDQDASLAARLLGVGW